MNSRIMRNIRVKSSIARYLGEFVADKSDGGFIQGTQWLVWKFESDTTLGDAMQARNYCYENVHSQLSEIASDGATCCYHIDVMAQIEMLHVTTTGVANLV